MGLHYSTLAFYVVYGDHVGEALVATREGRVGAEEVYTAMYGAPPVAVVSGPHKTPADAWQDMWARAFNQMVNRMD
jgi:hypothetical protein